MSRIPLNTLTAFRASPKLQNLRAAAEVLHLTHSAVSQQISGLEEHLGFAAVRSARTARRAEPGRPGAAAQRAGRRWRSSTTACRRRPRRRAATAQRLRITVLPSFAQRWLLPRIGRWRERHPDASRSRSTRRFDAVDLQREGFHAAMRQGTGPWPGLASERLFDAAADHRRRLAVGGATAAGRAARGAGARAAAGRRDAVEGLVRRRGRCAQRDARWPCSTTPG